MRVFAYGAKAPTQNAALVEQQIARAHRYYNVLIGLERDRRAATLVKQKEMETSLRAAYQKASVDVADLGEERNAKLVAQLVEAGHGRPSKWHKADGASEKAWAIAWRVWAEWREGLDVQLQPLSEQHKEQVKVERARCGTFWGTYLQIEDAVMRAAKSTSIDVPMRGRPWLGEGLVAVQIQGAMTSEELLSGEDSRARLLGEGRHRILWLRVGSEGRAPVWATFPVTYHRDLPPGAKIKWVRVHRNKVATHYRFSAQIVLDELPVPTPVPQLGTVGIDVGWRNFPGEGIRVAVWSDDKGQSGELRVPNRLLERWQKVDDLRSIRDKNFNAARDFLVVARRAAVGWPIDLMRETEHAHAWKSPERLSGIVTRWRTHRFEGDASLFGTLEAWRKQDKHLYEWECNQRENVLRARREVYRLFGRQMARYRTVVIERLDLRDFAEHPGPDEAKETYSLSAARGRRHFAALSELLGCIAQMTTKHGSELKETNAALTTRIHHECGTSQPLDPESKLRNVCSNCGLEYDVDYNAAKNILARALSPEVAPSKRAKVEVRDAQGKTAAEARRSRGIETRRAKRAQAEVAAPTE